MIWPLPWFYWEGFSVRVNILTLFVEYPSQNVLKYQCMCHKSHCPFCLQPYCSIKFNSIHFYLSNVCYGKLALQNSRVSPPNKQQMRENLPFNGLKPSWNVTILMIYLPFLFPLLNAFYLFLIPQLAQSLRYEVCGIDSIVNNDWEAVLQTKSGSGASGKRNRPLVEKIAQRHYRPAKFSNVQGVGSFISILKEANPATSGKQEASIPTALHLTRERERSRPALPAVKNPPAFPPFLPLMKTRGEDIRPSISHKSTSHVFWWIASHVLSPASSGDRAAGPYQHSSEDADNGTNGGYQALTSDALTQTANTSMSDHAIVRGGRWTPVGCCCTATLRLSVVRVLCVIGRRGL